MTVIILTIPEHERCKDCDGYGFNVDTDLLKRGIIASKRCEKCFGTGKKAPIKWNESE